MENPALVATWAAAFAAFFGPVVSIYMAHWLAKQQQIRVEASRLFGSIVEHAQDYRHAMLDMHAANELISKQRGLLLQMIQSNQGELNEIGFTNLQIIEQRYFKAFEVIRSLQSKLQTDATSVALLLRGPSKKCAIAIRTLADTIHDFDRESPPEFDAFQETIMERVANVSSEVISLHETIRKSDDVGAEDS